MSGSNPILRISQDSPGFLGIVLRHKSPTRSITLSPIHIYLTYLLMQEGGEGPKTINIKVMVCKHMSNERNPGWLGYIGDDILPIYIGIISFSPFFQDPYKPTRIQWKVIRFFSWLTCFGGELCSTIFQGTGLEFLRPFIGSTLVVAGFTPSIFHTWIAWKYLD